MLKRFVVKPKLNFKLKHEYCPFCGERVAVERDKYFDTQRWYIIHTKQNNCIFRSNGFNSLKKLIMLWESVFQK